MKRGTKTIIISMLILGVLLLIVSTLPLFLGRTPDSSSKSTIPIESLNNYNDQYRESTLSISSTSNNHGDYANCGNHGREITEPVANYAPINPGTIGIIGPVTSAPIRPGIVGPAVKHGIRTLPNVKQD